MYKEREQRQRLIDKQRMTRERERIYRERDTERERMERWNRGDRKSDTDQGPRGNKR